VHYEQAVTKVWVTVEGIEGVGKSHLVSKLADRLGGRCAVVAEITEQSGTSMPGRVISALYAAVDPFLRTGHPAAETLALIALKIREHELVRRRPGPGAEIVLEDRGIDTVAVYQALIIAGVRARIEEILPLMRRIYATAAHWRPLPDLTLLVVDDLNACIGRFQARLGRSLPPRDLALIGRANEIYTHLASCEPTRFVIIDRVGRSEPEAVDRMYAACVSRLETNA
jgi:dTMP kinase